MRLTLLLGVSILIACQRATPAPRPVSAGAQSIAADIDTLASPAFGGREAGTAGGDSAANFVARRYQQLGLRAAFTMECDSASRCPPSYFQTFRSPNNVFHNVGAFVDGLDSARRGEYVVIGAHFDHLGRSPTFSMDRRAGFVLRPGADDNASGTAAVLELARRLALHPTRRSVLLVNFDAEEEGLLGSYALLLKPPVPRDAIVFMLNLDMVGRLRGDRLFIVSHGIEHRIRTVFDSAAKTVDIRVQYLPSDDRSDDASFADNRIPSVQVSTGYHEDYHTAADVPARINVEGLGRVVDLAELAVRRIADR
jgi:Zn-dependent M28 family amino/carboxypeptidase